MSPPTKPQILVGCEVLPAMEPAPKPTSRSQATKTKRTPARRETADRFAVLNLFADVTLRGLTRAEIAVWLLLWRDTRDGFARTSQSDLASRAGMNVSTAKRAIARLESRGLLTVVFRGDLWRGPSRYAIHPTPKNKSEK